MKEKLITVGEAAKKLGVTVRTLQFYDKSGLLKPSNKSEGGRRLYSSKDLVMLHQILSLKYLGFSLEDIKAHIISLDTPGDVLCVLEKQLAELKEKLGSIQETIRSIEALQNEIHQINAVDFSKYADIISLLRLKNENYWVVKLLDNEALDKIKEMHSYEVGNAIINKWQNLCNEILSLHERGILSNSDDGQRIAKDWWDMVMEVAGGDMDLLSKLIAVNETTSKWNKEWQDMWPIIETFIKEGLGSYCKTNNIPLPQMEEPKV